MSEDPNLIVISKSDVQKTHGRNRLAVHNYPKGAYILGVIGGVALSAWLLIAGVHIIISLMAGFVVGIAILFVTVAILGRIRSVTGVSPVLSSSFEGITEPPEYTVIPTITIRPEDVPGISSAPEQPRVTATTPRLTISSADLPVLVIPPPPVAPTEPEGEDEGVCPFCRSKLKNGQALRTCPVCKTPHHQNCWDANGGCTTFGCSRGPR